MPLDPSSYLRCLSDRFTPVRDQQGRLLGCIPRVQDDCIGVGPHPCVIAAQACLLVNLDGPGPYTEALPGFIPLDDTNTDLAVPAPGTGGDDPDLAQGV